MWSPWFTWRPLQFSFDSMQSAVIQLVDAHQQGYMSLKKYLEQLGTHILLLIYFPHFCALHAFSFILFFLSCLGHKSNLIWIPSPPWPWLGLGSPVIFRRGIILRRSEVARVYPVEWRALHKSAICLVGMEERDWLPVSDDCWVSTSLTNHNKQTWRSEDIRRMAIVLLADRQEDGN